MLGVIQGEIHVLVERHLAAASFDVAPEADRLKAPHKIGLAFARSDLSAAIAQLPDEEERPVLALVTHARIQARDFDRLRKSIEGLVESFAAAGKENGDSYRLNICLYPGVFDIPEERRITLERKSKRPKG